MCRCLIALLLCTLAPLRALEVNVREAGARGDGLADDTAALQAALNGGARTVRIPAGTYLVRGPLKVESGTTILADPAAVIRLADHAGNDPSLCLLTNSDPAGGNVEITIEGGIWDGNNEQNPRGEKIPGYSGALLQFFGVRHFVLRRAVLRNPEAYAFRACHLEDFVIDDIGFDFSRLRPNQDGIHLNGFCERGAIRNLRALSPFATNDDMVALNADDGAADAFVTQQGMISGPIRNIIVENLQAPSAFTFVRLLSHQSPLENISISHVSGGCRFYAINMDRWKFPAGGGAIRHVTLRDFDVRKMADDFSAQKSPASRPLIHIQSAVQDFRIEYFRRPESGDVPAPTFVLENGCANELVVTKAGETRREPAASNFTIPAGGFELLTLESHPAKR